MLKEVVAKLHKEELAALPSDEYLRDHLEVSPEFHQKMMKLISHSYRLAMVRRNMKRVAAFFLAALATLLLLCTINEDIRAFCVRFLKENLFGGMTAYTSPADSSSVESLVEPDKDEIIGFRLGYVPEGFEYDEERSVVREGFCRGRLVYTNNKKGSAIVLRYFASDKGLISMDNQHSKVDVIQLANGSVCEYYKSQKEGSESALLWETGEYFCYLMIDDWQEGWEEKELIKIANNVENVFK